MARLKCASKGERALGSECCSDWPAVRAWVKCHFARGAIHTCLFQVQEKELIACIQAVFISSLFQIISSGSHYWVMTFMCPPNFYSILHELLDDLLCLIVDHPLNGMATFLYPLDSGLFGTCFVSAAIGLCVDQGSAFIPLFFPKDCDNQDYWFLCGK